MTTGQALTRPHAAIGTLDSRRHVADYWVERTFFKIGTQPVPEKVLVWQSSYMDVLK